MGRTGDDADDARRRRHWQGRRGDRNFDRFACLRGWPASLIMLDKLSYLSFRGHVSPVRPVREVRTERGAEGGNRGMRRCAACLLAILGGGLAVGEGRA